MREEKQKLVDWLQMKNYIRLRVIFDCIVFFSSSSSPCLSYNHFFLQYSTNLALQILFFFLSFSHFFMYAYLCIYYTKQSIKV